MNPLIHRAQVFAKNVRIVCEAASGELANDTIMPLALISNELLTNAVKHAQNGRDQVAIRLGLTREAGSYVLYIEDDGPGFEFEKARRRSSGLGLVIGLARQLGGTFQVERAPGARCTVRFPDQSTVN